jgi:N-acetylglutamate synthase-like GNAT family acetyltransferase
MSASNFGPIELERVLVDALRPTPDAELIDRPEWVQLSTPSLPDAHRNGVYLARLSEAEADATITEVARCYAERGAGFRWIIGPSSTPADLSARLERAGIPKLATALGMHMPVPIAAPVVPEGVIVRRVGPDDVERYAEVNARAWQRGPAFRRESEGFIARALARGDDSLRSWLVYEAGNTEAIGTATLSLLPGVGYFQGAAIVPERRRRGIYRALLHLRLAVLRELGIEHAVIWADESSSAGVCRRVGFVPRCRAVFHEQRPSEGVR